MASKLCVINCPYHPFFNVLELTTPPLKSTTSKCPAYKGTTDPMAYVIHFKMAMAVMSLLENKRKSIYCKLFVATFKDTMQQWFVELPPKSI